MKKFYCLIMKSYVDLKDFWQIFENKNRLDTGTLFCMIQGTIHEWTLSDSVKLVLYSV